MKQSFCNKVNAMHAAGQAVGKFAADKGREDNSPIIIVEGTEADGLNAAIARTLDADGVKVNTVHGITP